MKRFTETEKWRDVWFRKLTPVQKCLWQYLCDNCDSAGVIDLDVELAGFQIGADITRKDTEALAKGIETLSSGKLWVRGFVRFQFGQLSADCKPHKSVFASLEKHNIEPSRCYEKIDHTITEGLAKGCETLQEKEKDKDKDKDKEEVQEEKLYWPSVIYAAYPRKTGRGAALKAIHKALKAGKRGPELLEATQAYALAVSKWPESDNEFIPHPATWFNRESYDDDRSTWIRTDRNDRNGNRPEPQNVIRENLNAPMGKTTMELMLEMQEAKR